MKAPDFFRSFFVDLKICHFQTRNYFNLGLWAALSKLYFCTVTALMSLVFFCRTCIIELRCKSKIVA